MRKLVSACMLLAIMGLASCGGELVCEADNIGSVTVTNGTSDINMNIFFGGQQEAVATLSPGSFHIIEELTPGKYEIYGKEINATGPKEYPTGRDIVDVKQCEDTPIVLE